MLSVSEAAKPLALKFVVNKFANVKNTIVPINLAIE